MVKDEREIGMSPEERAMRHVLATAIVCEWVDDPERPGARQLVFDRVYHLHDFHERMVLGGDERGYPVGASVFISMMQELKVDPVIVSHLLTRLARSLYDITSQGFLPIAESQVSWFGRFLNPLLPEHTALFVRWCEDMDRDDPYLAFERQPTAVIRGAFFAPALDQRKCVPFWEAAVALETFPMRVFSDPCSSREGCIFSSYQRRVLTAILAGVSADAVRKIATHMKAQAAKRCDGAYVEGKWVETEVKACERDRRATFEMIALSILDKERRELVAECLGVQAQ